MEQAAGLRLKRSAPPSESGKFQRRTDLHAAKWKALPSKRNSMPNLASQMRVAFSSIAWNTGSSSPGELLMTCNTSEVAVCCSSASLRSSVR